MNALRRKEIIYFTLSLALFCVGLLYYIVFRDIEHSYLRHLPGALWLSHLLGDAALPPHDDLLNSLPSYLHVLALSYLTAGLMRANRKGLFFASLFWMGVNLLFEFGQGHADAVSAAFATTENPVPSLLWSYFSNGEFAWGDVGGCVLAFCTVNARAVFWRRPSDSAIGVRRPRAIENIMVACVLVIGVGSILGSSSCEDASNICPPTHEPIYLTFEELRAPVKTDKEVPLTNIGKIYVYSDYLFVNSRNSGVHVFDNHDPSNPIHLNFIKAPGNLDIAIKDGYLYVDSYVDLVAVDIRDPNNIQEVHRIKDVFPYDPYQNIPEGIYLKNIDKNLGVVVGYKENTHAPK